MRQINITGHNPDDNDYLDIQTFDNCTLSDNTYQKSTVTMIQILMKIYLRVH